MYRNKSIFFINSIIFYLDISNYISLQIASFLSSDPDHDHNDHHHIHQQKQFDILNIAVACLYSFIQTSWTGPKLDFEPESIIPVTQVCNYGRRKRVLLQKKKKNTF